MNSYANTAIAVRIPFWRKDESFAFLNSEVRRLFKTSKRFETLVRQAATALRDGKPVIIEAKPTAKRVVKTFVEELAYPDVVKLSFWRRQDIPKEILSEVRKLYKSNPAFARMLESYADKKAIGTIVVIQGKPNAKRVLEDVLAKLGRSKVASETVCSWQWLYRESSKFTERTNWTRISRARAWAITQDSGLSDCPPSLQKVVGYQHDVSWSQSRAIDIAAAPRLLAYRPHYETVHRPVEVENAHFVKEHLFDYNDVGELERIELLEARRLQKQLSRTGDNTKQLEKLALSALTLAKLTGTPISLDSSKAKDTCKTLIARANDVVKQERFELKLTRFDIEEVKPKLSDFQGEVVSYYDPPQRDKMKLSVSLPSNNDALLVEAQALLSIEPETDEDTARYLNDVETFLANVDAPLYHAEAKGLSKLAWSLRELTLCLENAKSLQHTAELKADAEEVELHADLDAPSILELLEEQVRNVAHKAPKGVIAALAQARLEASENAKRALSFQNGLSDLVLAAK